MSAHNVSLLLRLYYSTRFSQLGSKSLAEPTTPSSSQSSITDRSVESKTHRVKSTTFGQQPSRTAKQSKDPHRTSLKRALVESSPTSDAEHPCKVMKLTDPDPTPCSSSTSISHQDVPTAPEERPSSGGGGGSAQRNLRHRPSDAWYGVDLEYDDDEEQKSRSSIDSRRSGGADNHSPSSLADADRQMYQADEDVKWSDRQTGNVVHPQFSLQPTPVIIYCHLVTAFRTQ